MGKAVHRQKFSNLSRAATLGTFVLLIAASAVASPSEQVVRPFNRTL